MRTFIENYLHFMKNCIRPPYKKLKSLKSGFIENSNFENNRDPCDSMEIDDPRVFDNPEGISIGSMDLDDPKVYGNTSIFDGLVFISWKF